MSANTWQDIYIINTHPLMIDDAVVWDIFYLTADSIDVHCLRIFNVQLSFMIARLPGLERIDQFTRLVSTYAGNLHVEIRRDLTDANYFSFGRNREYLEIFSQSPFDLKKVLDNINKDVKEYYRDLKTKLEKDKEALTGYELLFYKNTETPFRYTSTTTNFNNTIYNLSTKYGIPLVGGARLNTAHLTTDFPQQFMPVALKPENISGLNAQLSSKTLEMINKRELDEYAAKIEAFNTLDPEAQKIEIHRRMITNTPVIVPHTYVSGIPTNWTCRTVNGNITASLIRDDKVDFKNNMTMLSYDIETYNADDSMDPTHQGNYIFAIGVGMFNLTDQHPYARYCIISKDFDERNPKSPLDGRPIKLAQTRKQYGCLAYVSSPEYSDPDEPDERDFTTYLVAKDEKHLLFAFVDLIRDKQPQIINGFNSFAFDDPYVWERLRLYGITDGFRSCFTYYDLDEMHNQKWFRSFEPQFKEFELKIDGEQRKDNKSMRSPLILTVDVRKLMLKEDPKRFTAYGRGNLDTMLEVYKVTNPFTSQPLSKTGLTYKQMFAKWDASKDIYEIALYCCQDAWICGTLLVKRAKIADLIELGGVSNTSFSDSIYRADGQRVANAILGYAYKENFAIMDTPFAERGEVKKHNPNTVQLGGKQFDYRTILGGAVRCVHAGRHVFITAADYASAYPAGKEGNNIDSSARVDNEVIQHPERFGLKIVAHKVINSPTDQKDVFYIKIL